MALPIRTLNQTHHVHPSDLTPLVTAITTCLQTLNPQTPNPSSSLINPSPLDKFSPYLDTNLVTQVISSQSSPYHSLFFFNWASNPNPNPNNYTHTHKSYVAITDLLLSHSLFSTASTFLEKHNKVSDLMASKFILAHGRNGNIKGSIFWFHKAKEIEKDGCLFSYNALLGVLVRTNRIDVAESFFRQIVEGGEVIKPDASTYTTMIRGFFKVGRVEEARKLFDEMGCDPNPVTYNIMIDGYCKKGDMDKARMVFYRMLASNVCLPNVVTYTTLIDGYMKKGEFDEAMKWMNDMMVRGCKPNVLTYNAVIYGLCMRGNVDEAKRFMTKMRLNGLRENTATRTSILKGLSVAGRSDEAITYFKEMLRNGMKPDAKLYGVVINENCKLRKPNKAIALLKEMKVRGIRPSVASYNVVLRILVEIGELDRAVSLLKQIPRFGGRPNFISFNTVIRGLCEAKGRMSEVETLVDIMLREGLVIDATMYGCMIKGYCEDGNSEMAVSAFYEALDRNYVIGHEFFLVLAKHLCGNGKPFEAKKLLDDMCRRCPVIDSDSYQRVLDE